jgi:mono/diheme cytochrome c family protein
MLGLSSSAGVVLLILGAIFVVAAASAIAARGRSRRPTADIPTIMKPGPSDPALETPNLLKLQGWGLLLVAFFVVWIPFTWLREPSQNLTQDRELNSAAIDRGSRAVQLYSEENQLGVGCVRCHGPQLTGGVIVSGTSFAHPPNLQTICGGNLVNPPHTAIASIDDIYQVIQQGRPPQNPVMPSWSIRYSGALDDQQINDIVEYLVSMSSKHVPFSENICLNPDAVKKATDKANAAQTNLLAP